MNNLPIFVTPPNVKVPSSGPAPPIQETPDLLRQLIEIQREQLSFARAAASAADHQSRWRHFLARWQDEFPTIGSACKEVLPVIERSYLRMIQELADRLRGDDPEDLENEYILAEFLDKYGLRLSQLGTIVGQLTPLADAAPAPREGPVEESESS